MTSPSPPTRLLQRSRLARRVGGLLTSPSAALREIGREGGALSDAVALVVIGVIAFRLPDLINALLTVFATSGGFVRLLGVLSVEVREAAWVVLPAAVTITALAGKGRDAVHDLDLGAACYVPTFAVHGLTRAIDAVAQYRVFPPTLTTALGALGAAAVVVPAIRIARQRLGAGAPEGAPKPSAAATGGPPAPASGTAPALAALVVLAIVLTGFAGNAVWSSRHIEALRPMRHGHAAPTFALPLVGAGGETSQTLSSDSLRGKVALLDFWATWCEPCLAMIPVLHDLHRDWAPRGLQLVGINSDGGGATAEEVAGFVAKHRFPYPVVLDREGEVGARYKVQALPSLVVVGRDGRVRATFMGYTRRETLEKEIGRALGEGTEGAGGAGAAAGAAGAEGAEGSDDDESGEAATPGGPSPR